MEPEGVPSRWSIFFGAEDVDKTLRVSAKQDAKVLRGTRASLQKP
jgi:hypothetical protein